MMEYLVCEGNDALELIREVDKAIKEGYLPQGGISVSISESDTYSYTLYAQAMIRRKK